MAVDDFQFLDRFKGKRIKLTLKSATFLATVQRINLSKTIVVEDVVDVKTGKKFPGVKLFFGHEILNVEFANKTKSEQGEPSDRENVLEGQLTVAEFQPYRKSIALDDEDEEYVNFMVVDEFHEKFGPAVMHIRKQQVIGIGADGVGAFQHERLCWLQIATKNKVYLFDVLQLGARAFKNGLSMILENQHILKVTHDCRGMAGCLMTQFGVTLTNVFDTQVADVLCFYNETGGFLPDRVGTLQEMVSTHLKMPPSQLSSLQIKSQLTKDDRQVWYVRPCPVPLLKVMALSVIHLLPLRLVLLDSLMADYTGLVDAYLSGSRDHTVHMQHIGSSSVLELPKELRELEQMRLERREWATERYPVTEQGLLKRPDPRVVQPQHPSSSLTENQDRGPTLDPCPATEPQTPASTLTSFPITMQSAAPSPTLQRAFTRVEPAQAPDPNQCRSPEPAGKPPSFTSLVTPAINPTRDVPPAATAFGHATFSSSLSTSNQPLTSSSSSSTHPLTSSSSSSTEAPTPSQAPSVVPSSSSSAPAPPPSYTPVLPRSPSRDLTLHLSTNGPIAPPGGPGLHDILMETMGRGSTKTESVDPTASFSMMGRGFILQAAAALTPQDPSRPPSGPAAGVQPKPCKPAVAAHSPGLTRGQCVPASTSAQPALTSALSLSFSSFRKT